MILSEWCTVTSQSQDCSSGIWWTVNDVFLAGTTDVCEDQVEDGCSNTWLGIADCFGQRSKMWCVHDEKLQTMQRLSMKALNFCCLERRSIG